MQNRYFINLFMHNKTIIIYKYVYTKICGINIKDYNYEIKESKKIKHSILCLSFLFFNRNYHYYYL